MARYYGQRYVTKKGVVVEGKSFEDTQFTCKLKCNENVTTEKRKSLFKSIWKMGSFVKQNTYICGLIQKHGVKQRRGKTMKISDEDLNFVKEHIEPFPLYESHYTRKYNPHQKYLQESLNLHKVR